MGGPSILFVAPFARGVASGGSQRASSIAEALEQRGAAVDWLVTEQKLVRRPQQIAASLTGPPLPVLSMEPVAPAGRFDVVCASHSYLGPTIRSLGGKNWVDFHNIEADHMLDNSAAGSLSKRFYWRRQSKLMAKLEADTARRADVVTAATVADASRIQDVTGVDVLVVPNILPRYDAETFRRIRTARGERAPAPRLVFIGTLDYLPNIISVDQFLRSIWPTIRAANPSVGLDIVGRCSTEDSMRWAANDGVIVHGFVDDLSVLLVECAGAVLPLEMRAGSSLRILAFGLAGIPMVGSPEAFRSFAQPGLVATDQQSWLDAVSDVLTGGGNARTIELQHEVEHLQSDPRPFDALFEQLA